MTVTTSLSAPGRALRRPGRGLAGERRRAGYLFVSLYVVLLVLFGVAPTAYALYLSLTRPGAKWAGLHNFLATAHDYRFVPALEHIAVYLLVWLAVLVVLVLLLALLLHGGIKKLVPVFRFLFYIPGALAGSASVLVWLFMLDPPISPWHPVESLFHLSSLPQVVEPGHLPFISAMIAFWTGAGGWIVVMNGALNNISDEVLESARIDGANAVPVALRVKLPLIRKWVVYMVILAFAAGTQLFVEPTLVSTASFGEVSQFWSPNQLAYYTAFTEANFNYAAAIAVDLLIVCALLAGLLIVCALLAGLLVFRSKLFEIE